MIHSSVSAYPSGEFVLFDSSDCHQQESTFCDEESSWLDTDFEISAIMLMEFGVLDSYRFVSCSEVKRLHIVLVRHTDAATDVDERDRREGFSNVEYFSDGSDVFIEVFLNHIRTDVLMDAFDDDAIFLTDFLNFLNLIAVHTEFTLRSTCDRCLAFTTSYIRIYSYGNAYRSFDVMLKNMLPYSIESIELADAEKYSLS